MNQNEPDEFRIPPTKVFLVWVLLAAASGVGVYGLHEFGPRILYRDQEQSSWRLLDRGWKTLEGIEHGTPEYAAALERAEPHFREAVSLSPKNGKCKTDLARILFERGKLEEAYEVAREGIDLLEEADGYTEGFLGELAMKLELYEEAEASLLRAVELEPKNPVHRERLAFTLLERGKVDEGIEVYRERLETLPALPFNRIHAAYFAAKAGRWKEADEWFEIPAEEGLLNGSAWLVVGVVRAANGRSEEAAKAFVKYQRNTGRTQSFPEDKLNEKELPPLDRATLRDVRAAYRRATATSLDRPPR